MKILLCHNYYQHSGGEDRVFADEVWLLKSRGHDVQTFTLHNDSIQDRSKLAVAAETLWNRGVSRHLRNLVAREGFEVVHFHNTFPLISPAAYYAARAAGAAVVQTLHNFRLLCPQATFLRDGRICTDCLTRRVAWPAVVHGCYRGSRSATATLAASLSLHRALGTYQRAVDGYIALTDFAREMFTTGGRPAEKLTVKPNFVRAAPAVGTGAGGYALYVGRLSTEKGIDSLLAAWQELDATTPLHIIGDGPLGPQVAAAVNRNPAIVWRGALSSAEVEQAMRDATCLILPSTCYEGLPKTLVEAFSVGTPVIASRIGAFVELVEPGRTGELFTPGEPAELARTVKNWFANRTDSHRMRQEARAEFEASYTAARNYDMLLALYGQALHRRFPGRSVVEEDSTPAVESTFDLAART